MKQKGFAPLILILVIAILGVVGYFGYVNFKTLSKTDSVNSSHIPEVDKPVEISKSKNIGDIAYLYPESNGNVWLVDNGGKNKRQLTKTNDISDILSWSPGGNNVLFKNNENVYGTLNIDTKEINRFPDLGTILSYQSFTWLNNKEVVYIDPNSVPKMVRVTTDNKKQVGDLPSGDSFAMSASGNLIAYLNSQKVFIYDVPQKSNIVVTDTANSDRSIVGWVGDNLLFKFDGDMWSFNILTKQKQVVVPSKGQWEPYYGIDATEKAILYQGLNTTIPHIGMGNGKYFIYDLINGKSLSITKGQDVGEGLSDETNIPLSLSPDSNYVLVRVAKGVNILNIKDMTTKSLCTSCSIAMWQK